MMTREEAIRILERKTTIPEDGVTWEQINQAMEMAISVLRAQQDSNDPLTPEELREMDGEPVWVEMPGRWKKWALVYVWAKSTNVIYLTCNNGMVLHPLSEIESGAKIYRRRL